MKIFVSIRSIDLQKGSSVQEELLNLSENSLVLLKLTEHSEDWKKKVEEKMIESDFVVFLLGSKTFKSEQIIWEYSKAKSLNKQIVGIKLPDASSESILFCQGFQVFNSALQALKYLDKIFIIDRQLKLEQYKIMVSSTEKVTDQRMKVNNLFFTVTSSILSVAFVLGKTYSFIPLSVFAMLVLTFLALLTTHFWKKLVNSYGNLNKGKFILIGRLEKELRTNLFDEEWEILTKEIKYEPNTRTEVKIIERFRYFIIFVLLTEAVYLTYNAILIYNLFQSNL